MGKAAKNEKLKLRATFYNNTAVGLALGGALIPYLVAVQKLGDILAWARDHGPPAHFTMVEWATIITPIVAFFLALQGARHFRRVAGKTIEKLQD